MLLLAGGDASLLFNNEYLTLPPYLYLILFILAPQGTP